MKMHALLLRPTPINMKGYYLGLRTIHIGIGPFNGKYMYENTVESGPFSSLEDLKAFYRNLAGRPRFPSSVTATQIQQGAKYFDVKTGGSTYPGYDEATRVYIWYRSN